MTRKTFLIDINEYVLQLTTAKCASGKNSPDFSSIKITAEKGDVIAYDNVDFTGAKCLLLEAAVSPKSARTVELYIDVVAVENKIGIIYIGGRTKADDFDFSEYYADIPQILGIHRLIFRFTGHTELEADFFRLSSYTGLETEAERASRMKWWKAAKYGMFIHLGAYSYLGGEYLGRATGWYSEWIMDTFKIPKEDYAKNAAAHFNPKDFDAKKIVAAAKSAGQKYIVITSRHHEGLSIYDTKIRNFRDFCLMNKSSCPEYSGGDILKELSEECRKSGIHFGAYVTIMDWHDQSQEGWNESRIADGHDKSEYVSQLKGQVLELLENYGAEVLFFDGEWVDWWTEEDGRALYRFIRTLSPGCIVNNRVGKRNPSDGDYGTPEQEIPAEGLGYDWESNVTMNDSWGYKKGDENWKSPQWIISSILDIASKGGNLLLNVGPDGNGALENAPVDNMSAAGKWLMRFGEAVYGTEKSCFKTAVDDDIRVTSKPAEGKIYISLLETDPSKKGRIILPPIDNKIVSIKELESGRSVEFEATGKGIAINVQKTEKQDYATVYEMTVEGEPTERRF